MINDLYPVLTKVSFEESLLSISYIPPSKFSFKQLYWNVSTLSIAAELSQAKLELSFGPSLLYSHPSYGEQSEK
jgi:hypothetical protein